MTHLLIFFWIPFGAQVDYLATRGEAIVLLKGAFDAAGITIPFPIRTLEFGVLGGRPLAEELERAPWPRATS